MSWIIFYPFSSFISWSVFYFNFPFSIFLVLCFFFSSFSSEEGGFVRIKAWVDTQWNVNSLTDRWKDNKSNNKTTTKKNRQTFEISNGNTVFAISFRLCAVVSVEVKISSMEWFAENPLRKMFCKCNKLKPDSLSVHTAHTLTPSTNDFYCMV